MKKLNKKFACLNTMKIEKDYVYKNINPNDIYPIKEYFEKKVDKSEFTCKLDYGYTKYDIDDFSKLNATIEDRGLPDSFSFEMSLYKLIQKPYKRENRILHAYLYSYLNYGVELRVYSDSLNYCEKTIVIMEQKLGLTPKERVVKKDKIWIGYPFNKQGEDYKGDLEEFFSLFDFKVITGKKYSGESVKDKVRRRIKSQDLVVQIWSKKEDDDYTWIRDEGVGASFLEKPLIILKEEGLEINTGILGDIEYITFPEGHISEAFIQLIYGLRKEGFDI